MEILNAKKVQYFLFGFAIVACNHFHSVKKKQYCYFKLRYKISKMNKYFVWEIRSILFKTQFPQ